MFLSIPSLTSDIFFSVSLVSILLAYFNMPNDSSVLLINAGENLKDWDKLKELRQKYKEIED